MIDLQFPRICNRCEAVYSSPWPTRRFCDECRRARDLERYRKWNTNNKARVRERQRKWYQQTKGKKD
jgi:hypothetical protein